jgi:hypothetical protein
MKPMKNDRDFPSELPAKICSKLDQDFRNIFEYDGRNRRILRHYLRQIELRRMDVETASQAAAYDIVGKNKQEGKFERNDKTTYAETPWPENLQAKAREDA